MFVNATCVALSFQYPREMFCIYIKQIYGFCESPLCHGYSAAVPYIYAFYESGSSIYFK